MADNTVEVIFVKTPVSVVTSPPRRVEVVQVGTVISGGGESVVSWSEITNKPTTFPPTTHNHDDRYYTESEVDTKLSTISLTPGPKGDTGDTGAQGIQGVKGDTGAQGPKGDTGAAGAPATNQFIVLSASEPVPGGTPAGTVILRTA